MTFSHLFPTTVHVGILYYILLIVQSPTIIESVRAKISGDLHIFESHYQLTLGKTASHGEKNAGHLGVIQ